VVKYKKDLGGILLELSIWSDRLVKKLANETLRIVEKEEALILEVKKSLRQLDIDHFLISKREFEQYKNDLWIAYQFQKDNFCVREVYYVFKDLYFYLDIHEDGNVTVKYSHGKALFLKECKDKVNVYRKIIQNKTQKATNRLEFIFD
jgi:hypothetical protein